MGRVSTVPNNICGGEIRLLTINMFMRPPGVTTNGDDYKIERLHAFAENHMENFDVICFQELFSLLAFWKERMVSLAQQKGLIYHVVSPTPWFFEKELCDGGLLIVSRYPIVDTSFTRFDASIIPLLADAFCTKGLLYAKIALEEMNLHLFNTHC